MKKSVKKETLEWLKIILIAVGLAIIVRTFLFSSYIVEGESMMPTLQDGNLLIINKITYDIGEVDRFDVIVFHHNENEDYVKRVIGLPGDHVEYKADTLYVNGKAYDEEYLQEYKKNYSPMLLTEDFKLEDLTGEMKVPEGKLFVLGDNRHNSTDSRVIGFVDIDEQVVGKVNVRYWPISKLGVKF